MNIKELIMAAEKLQIDPSFYCLSGKDAVRNTDYYGIARNKKKWEIYYCDWHGPDVKAVFDTEEEACEAFYRILKDEEDRLATKKGSNPDGMCNDYKGKSYEEGF